MAGMRLGTVVVLIAFLFACGAKQEPVADTGGSNLEIAPTADPVVDPVEHESVPGFDDEEVRAYAARTELAGDMMDANAEQWSTIGIEGTYDSIDGKWSARWNYAPQDLRWETGSATVESVGNRVLIRYEDKYEYLIEVVRDGDRLVGRYVAPSDLTVTRPWVGRIVSNDRIDGTWPTGRWDLRRGGAGATEKTSP